MKRDTVFSLITLVIIIPIIFANVWFLMEIWNKGVLLIFNNLPILTYKNAFIVSVLKSFFGLDFNHSTSWFIEQMINKQKSELEVNFYTTVGSLIVYSFTWFIIIKIII